MLEFFDIKTRPAQKDDPANCDYIELTPKAANAKAVNFTKLQMWIDRDTHLPVKIVSDEKDKTTKTGIFKDIKPNVKIDPSVFSPEKPAGWELTVEPLEKK